MIDTKAFVKTSGAFLLAMFCFLSAWSQEVDPSELIEKKDGRTWRLALEARRTNNLYLAQNYLEQLYGKDSTENNVIEELAEIYRLTHNYAKTEKFYQKILAGKKGENHPEALFYVGQASSS